MALFNYQNGKLKKLKLTTFNMEKELQALVEKNLQEVMDMYFLQTEYMTTMGGRIDTLAVDYNGAPVIIEYKKKQNENIINQALSYLKWLKSQKIEFFEMLINRTLGDKIPPHFSIDWKNPRVICIAESYNKYDTDMVEVLPIRIELYRFRYYENDIFSLEPVNISEQSSTQSPGGDSPVVIPELGNIDDHLAKAPDQIKNLFYSLREEIFKIDESIIEKSTSEYVAYRMGKNFAEVHVRHKYLILYLRPIEYKDPNEMIQKVPESYNWTLDRRVYLKSEDDLNYIVDLVRQSFSDVI